MLMGSGYRSRTEGNARDRSADGSRACGGSEDRLDVAVAVHDHDHDHVHVHDHDHVVRDGARPLDLAGRTTQRRALRGPDAVLHPQLDDDPGAPPGVRVAAGVAGVDVRTAAADRSRHVA
jgi:hypothetical protein